MTAKIEYVPIGTIHSPFREPAGAPIQSSPRQEFEATIELFPEYTEALDDLEGFDCIWVLWHCHCAKPWSLKAPSFLDNQLRGVFATRAPSRPNAIGLSAVRLLAREKNILHIQGVDMIDQTPVLDLKPYIPSVDSRPDCARDGWLAGRKLDQVADNRYYQPPDDKSRRSGKE